MVLDNSADYEHYGSSGKLWKKFGCVHSSPHDGCTGQVYVKRNALMATLIGLGAPQQVFEFAGNGGFMMQAALLDSGVRKQLVRWVHSDFSVSSLDYAIVLASNYTLLRNRSVNIDEAVAARRAAGVVSALPFSTALRIDDVASQSSIPPTVTVMRCDVRKPCVDLSTFDTVASISFEHIKEDLQFVESLKVGTRFVFGAATFPHPEHHHYFQNASSVRERYCSLLNISGVYLVKPIKGGIKSLSHGGVKSRSHGGVKSLSHGGVKSRSSVASNRRISWHVEGEIFCQAEVIKRNFAHRYLERPTGASHIQLIFINIR
ncbi:MAG: hypothetical protein SGPRY_005861, partial [Prymnesium sp.]